MKPEQKQQIINDLVITEKTQEFISKMMPNHGNLIENTKKKDDTEPDFMGYGKLSTGQVIAIQGNIKPGKHGHTMPILIVELPDERIDSILKTPKSEPKQSVFSSLVKRSYSEKIGEDFDVEPEK